MNNREALQSLLAHVEAGQGIPMGYRADNMDCGPLNVMWSKVDAAYKGSLDAAKALHEAVLPGWAVEIICRPFGLKPHQWHVVLSTDHTGWGDGKYCRASGDEPARAWLQAILRALIDQQPESERPKNDCDAGPMQG